MTSTVPDRVAASLSLSFLVLAGACSDASGPKVGPPATVMITSGNGQSAEVGTALPNALVVRVTDASDKPIQGATVNWIVTTGGGTTSASAAATDGTGSAHVTWTLGTTAGANTVAATSGVASANFTASGTAGPPAKLVMIAGQNQSGVVGAPLPLELAVRVEDRFGNPAGQAAVTWAVLTGGGSVAPQSTASDMAGMVRARWTLGTLAGTQTVSAAASGSMPVTFAGSASPSVPARMEVVQGHQQSGAVATVLTQPLTVRILDQFDNPVVGARVTWTASGDGAISPINGATTESGTATASWILGPTAGPQTATASSGSMVAAFTATALPGPLAKIAVSPAAVTAKIGAILEFTATLRDVYGNAHPARPIAWSSSSPAVAIVAPTGIVSAIGLGSAVITATVDGFSGSGVITVQPTLTIMGGGSGVGAVTGGGINCTISAGAADGVCSVPARAGESLILTATPATGSVFYGWGGACGGSAIHCEVAIAQDRSVTATFDTVPPKAPVVSGVVMTLVGIRSQNCTNEGSEYAVRISFTDANGDVPLAGTKVEAVFPSNRLLLTGTVVTGGTGARGEVETGFCVRFNSSSSFSVTLYLFDSAQQKSNGVWAEGTRPPGSFDVPEGPASLKALITERLRKL